MFVTSFSPTGVQRFVRQFGTATVDTGHGIDVAADGSFYVVGETAAAIGQDPAPGARDFFVAAFDSSATLLWTRQLGTVQADTSTGVAVAGSRVYASGSSPAWFPGVDGGTNPSTKQVLVGLWR